MAAFINNDITAAGLIVLAKGAAGQKITYTKIVLGDGYLEEGQTPRSLTGVVSPKAVIDITKLKVNTDGTVAVGGIFTNDQTSDGFFYRDRTVAVVGGGDSACEEALYLSGLARKVYMIVRKDYLRASEAMKSRVMSTANIEVLFGCSTREILGDALGVTGARLARENGEIFEIKIDGFFLAIGRHPNTEWLGGGLALTQDGYIKSEGVKTEVEGVFVAGDVRNTDFRQAITAAADGCRAALEAEKYIKNKF